MLYIWYWRTPPYIWRQVLPLHLELTDSGRQAGQSAPWSACLSSQHCLYRSAAIPGFVYLGAEAPNSSLHTCTTDTYFTKWSISQATSNWDHLHDSCKLQTLFLRYYLTPLRITLINAGWTFGICSSVLLLRHWVSLHENTSQVHGASVRENGRVIPMDKMQIGEGDNGPKSRGSKAARQNWRIMFPERNPAAQRLIRIPIAEKEFEDFV